MIIINLLRVLAIISRQQILTNAGEIKLPLRVKIIANCLELIFYPLGLIKKPTKNFGYRLTSCFEKLGPIYIKFGQTLSTRPDLVSHEVAKNLQYLQDALPPFSSELAKQIIYSTFAQTTEQLFSSFEDVPVAAASISQVHKAKTKTGEDIAIKILRPNIHNKYNDDIKLLYFLAKLITKITAKFNRLRLIQVVKLFEQTMYSELDLRLEAAAISEMADNLKFDQEIYIPKVYWQLTSENIMTTEWVEGISIYDTTKIIEQGLNPSELAAKIAVMFFNQAYRDGFFHADLHPGNILVKPDGKIALLDFGIMGRLSEQDRLAIAEILFGFLSRDYKLVANVHLQAGYIPKNTNLYLFAQSCRAVCEPIIGLAIKDISIGKLLAQLFKVTKDFGMETQPQLLLLQKTMVVVEGIGQSLDHEINMWQLAEPWITRWAAKNLSPEAKFLRFMKKTLIRVITEQDL